MSVEPQQRHEPVGGVVFFDRPELDRLLRLYGRMVAAGEWRDYAIDHAGDRAVFSVFRRTSETPLFQIIKAPRLARRDDRPRPASAFIGRGSGLMPGARRLRLRVLWRSAPRRPQRSAAIASVSAAKAASKSSPRRAMERSSSCARTRVSRAASAAASP